MSQQNNEIAVDEQYKSLVEDIKGTITEAVHNSRWDLVEGYWNVGKLIRKAFTGHDLTKQLQGLGVDVGISKTTLWYALQAYDKYPDITALPEGKNISWNKLTTKYLPASSMVSEKIEKLVETYKCPKCGYIFKLDEQTEIKIAT
jgi:hypothetical protein